LVALSENGDCEVATDKDAALERLVEDGAGHDLAGTVCRVVKLNVIMSLPHGQDDDDDADGPAVDVAVPNGAGRNIEVEIE
jgi:hypothetical protein